MTRQTQTQETQTSPKAPDFIAWQVERRDEKSYWTRIGAAWDHKDGNGTTLQLDALPVDGRIVLRRPLEPKADEDKA